MATKAAFPRGVVETVDKGKILGIRAGTKPHRFIGVWVVVVEGRIFIRGYYLRERSWHNAFLEDPRGTMQIADGREIPVRAIRTRSERLKDAVSDAYKAKYNTPASLTYVRGFRTKARKDTTTELVPR